MNSGQRCESFQQCRCNVMSLRGHWRISWAWMPLIRPALRSPWPHVNMRRATCDACPAHSPMLVGAAVILPGDPAAKKDPPMPRQRQVGLFESGVVSRLFSTLSLIGPSIVLPSQKIFISMVRSEPKNRRCPKLTHDRRGADSSTDQRVRDAPRADVVSMHRSC
jgi:hypothetical protein